MITHVERLDDGRYNIVLRGLERFRIVEEDHGAVYRRAVIEPLAERPLDGRRPRGRQRTSGRSSRRCWRRRSRQAGAESADRPAAMTDEDLVNALAQYLDLEPLEKQALLEHDSLAAAPSRSSSCSR